MDEPTHLPAEEPSDMSPLPEEHAAPSIPDPGRIEPIALNVEEQTWRRRSFRRNLAAALWIALVAFAVTVWALVQVDSRFGLLSSSPAEVVQAQLHALDHGNLRAAYDLFSPHYRQQVSFTAWHDLVITHWRMFHSEIVRTGQPLQIGREVNLDIHLRGADDQGYRAHFTLILLQGRWWIDDTHWSEESDGQHLLRT